MYCNLDQMSTSGFAALHVARARGAYTISRDQLLGSHGDYGAPE